MHALGQSSTLSWVNCIRAWSKSVEGEGVILGEVGVDTQSDFSTKPSSKAVTP
jgi:hypothetical protein